MKLEELFHVNTMLITAVPLAIKEPGIAYLNDIHVWVITLNRTHPAFDPERVSVKAILELMEHYCSCYPNQQPHFEQERAEIIKRLKEADAQASIDILLH